MNRMLGFVAGVCAWTVLVIRNAESAPSVAGAPLANQAMASLRFGFMAASAAFETIRLSLQLDGDAVELAAEPERRRVAEVDRRAGVLADVLPFGERVFERRGLLDPAFADLPAVRGECDGSALRHAAAVVLEVHRECDLAGRHRFGGDDAIAFESDVVVQPDEPALLDVKAPSAGEAALGEDHALRTTGGDFRLGGDSERLVLEVWRGSFRQRRERRLVHEPLASGGKARLAGQLDREALG